MVKAFNVYPRFTLYAFTLHMAFYVIDNVRSFLPKCPLTTVRSRFSADELQIVRGEADDTFVVRPH